MIRRSILVCAAAILAWHFLMPVVSGRFYTVPGMQRANYDRAQRFVHSAPADVKVIVGSSMSDRLDEVQLGPQHVKLTFPAGGPFTGLEIIRETGRRPPVVWIETNVITRDADQALLDDVLSPWRKKLREASSIFKEEGRPSEAGVGFLKSVISKITKKTETPAADQEADEDALEGIMKANRENLSKPVPDLQQRVSRLASYVDELTANGTICVLFEMPVDESLKNLTNPASIREAVSARFPKDKYRWLEMDSERPWKTTDGIHLTPEEVKIVVERMLAYEKTLP